MDKKTLFASIVLIGCIILLIGSYMQWNGKISSAGVQSPTLISPSEKDKDNEKSDTPAEPGQDIERLLALTANADEQVQTVVQDRLESGENLDFLIAGSTTMDEGKPGYAERLKTALENAYGDFLNVTIKSSDTTSDSFVENLNDELDLDQKFDIILFEPFNLKNNGVITPEDQEEYIKLFQNRLKEKVEDAVLVLHPSQPLHQAVYYPLEVESIRSFASSINIPYVNHWTDWPAVDSDDLPNFLDDDNAPNDAGAEVWANALIKYFIAE